MIVQVLIIDALGYYLSIFKSQKGSMDMEVLNFLIITSLLTHAHAVHAWHETSDHCVLQWLAVHCIVANCKSPYCWLPMVPCARVQQGVK